MRKKYIRDIETRINKTGAKVVSASLTNGAHLRFEIVDPVSGVDGYIICSATPRAKGVFYNILRDVRGVLNPAKQTVRQARISQVMA